MKRYKYLFLVVLIVACWSCADAGLEVEEDMLFATELNLASDKLTAEDFLDENSPTEFKYATDIILGNRLGLRLMQKIKIIPNRVLIRFVLIMDQEGNVGTTGEFRYYGNGWLGYNYIVLHDPKNDELLFHEFFHFFQCNGMNNFQRNRNNELEAYMAQYLYVMRKGNPELEIIDPVFTLMLGFLATYIDKNTGKFLPRANLEEFYKTYQSALNYLAMLPAYKDGEWFNSEINQNVNPFPNILRLME